MENRYIWDNSDYEKRKNKATKAYNNVKELMNIIQKGTKEKNKEKNLDSKILKAMLFDSKDYHECMGTIYRQLCVYYNNNPSLWSNFTSMWKKLHQMQHCKIGQSTNKRDIAARAIIGATGAKGYCKVKKGIIPVLRLSIPGAKNLCESILSEENNLKTILKQGSIKIKTEDLPDDGPLFGSD